MNLRRNPALLSGSMPDFAAPGPLFAEWTMHPRVRIVGDDLHGKIVIEYYSSEDLDRIYGLIVRAK